MRPRLSDDGRTVTLDLHGARVDEAVGLLHRTARLAAERGRVTLRVVHGASTSGAHPRTIRGALHALLVDGALAPDVTGAVRFEGHALLSLRAAPRPDPTPLRLLDVMGEPVASLPYGKRRLLEIATALACAPRVLLLDEPAAGVPEGERHEIFAAVDALPAEVSILLIEHDMDLVFSFARTVTVLVNGAVFAEGSAAAIAADARVKAVYLGEGDDTVAAHG